MAARTTGRRRPDRSATADSPAGFGKTTAREQSAITRLRTILLNKPVIPHIEEMSTLPNIDGYLYMVAGEQCIPEGVLAAQVKTLTPADWRRHGYSAPRSFLAYSRDVPSPPVLLIGIHPTQCEALWVHVSPAIAQGLLRSSPSAHLTVRFPPANTLSERTSDLSAWRTLATRANSILRAADECNLRSHEIRNLSALVNDIGTPVSFDFDARKVQTFLDDLNHLLDGAFAIVKRLLYGDAWKVGIGVVECTPRQLTYALFRIGQGTADLPIKQIRIGSAFAGAKTVTSHFTRNPIYEEPNVYARKLVDEMVQKIIHDGGLDVADDLLGRETIFGACWRGPLCRWLGVEKRGTYSVEEIERGLKGYFPNYLTLLLSRVPNEFARVIEASLAQRGALSVEDLENFVAWSGQDLSAISAEAQERVRRGERGGFPFPVFAQKVNLRRLWTIVSQLKAQGHDAISDPYRRVAWPSGQGGGATYTSEEIVQNVRVLYENLPMAFESTVRTNFPTLAGIVRFFEGFDMLICVVETGRRFFGGFPGLAVYRATAEPASALRAPIALVLPEQEARGRLRVHADLRGGEIDGIRFRLGSVMETLGDAVFTPAPLSSLVEKELSERLKTFLSKSA